MFGRKLGAKRAFIVPFWLIYNRFELWLLRHYMITYCNGAEFTAPLPCQQVYCPCWYVGKMMLGAMGIKRSTATSLLEIGDYLTN